MSNLTLYKPRSFSRVATSALTTTVRQRMSAEQNTHIAAVGTLTPESVRESSQRAQRLKQQIMLAKKYQGNSEKIGEYLAELESIRAEMLKAGAKQLSNTDRTLKGAVLTNARHENAMREIQGSTQGELQKLRAQGGYRQAEQRSTLEQDLRAMQATHQAEMGLIASQGRANLGEGVIGVRNRARMNQQNARQNRQLREYIDGKPMGVLSVGGWFR